MTNEELVVAYQQGNEDAIEKLWLQIINFIEMQASKYLQQYPSEYQSLKDDLVQQSFFSVRYAAEHFDSAKGISFLSYFSKCLPKSFHEVIFSGRGSRLENEPLNTALSLDKPLYENDDGSVVTLGDTLAEPCKELEDIEADDYWKSVNIYMKKSFRKYGTEMGAAILSYMMDNDCSFKEAVLALYDEDISTSRKVRSKYEYHKKQTEFKFKRHLMDAKEERRMLFLDELFIGSHGLRDTGYKYFRQAGMSSVERAVINRSERSIVRK